MNNQSKLNKIFELAKSGSQNKDLAIGLLQSQFPNIYQSLSNLYKKDRQKPYTCFKDYCFGDQLWFNCQEIDSNFFPPCLRQMKNFKNVGFSSCAISDLPNTLFKMDSIIGLSLTGSKCKKIHKNLSKMKSLRFLLLGENSFSKIPESVFSLTNLRTLMLFENNIEDIPSEIKNLKNLRKISLVGNPIVRDDKKMEALRKWLQNCLIIRQHTF